jgi:hypothetical protein
MPPARRCPVSITLDLPPELAAAARRAADRHRIPVGQLP